MPTTRRSCAGANNSSKQNEVRRTRSSVLPEKSDESPKKEKRTILIEQNLKRKFNLVDKRLSTKGIQEVLDSDDESDHGRNMCTDSGEKKAAENRQKRRTQPVNYKESSLIKKNESEALPKAPRRTPRKKFPKKTTSDESKALPLSQKTAFEKSSSPRHTFEMVSSESEDCENQMGKANNSIHDAKVRKNKALPQTSRTPNKKQKKNQSVDTPVKNLTHNFENSCILQTEKKSLPKQISPKVLSTPQNTRRSQRQNTKKYYGAHDNSYDDFHDGDDEDKDADFKTDEENVSDSSDEGTESSEEINSEESENETFSNYNRKIKASKISVNTPRSSRKLVSTLTPSVRERIKKVVKPSTPLQEARLKLHVSVLPKSLPCREEQFNDIYTFLHGRLSDCSGGCIYISGVPGTGKTATVNEVIRCLKKAENDNKLPEFDFIDINGMKLSEPRQAYVQIWKQLVGESKTWEEAQKLLQNKFTKSRSKRKMILLLVDELDLLCTKRQDVVYNLLDWPSKENANLVVVTIANTMDLPERILMGRVTSRLGLTRLTFPTYTYKQLEEIVSSRLKGFDDAFSGETVQLVARKVAAVSGDARRALDICRRATEIAENNKRETVTMAEIQQALSEMIASPKIQAIKNCSDMEKFFLKAVCAEVHRTGVEEVVFKNVYIKMEELLRIERLEILNTSEVLDICSRLGSYRLLICEHSKRDIHQRLLLNVSTDDVHFAIQNA